MYVGIDLNDTFCCVACIDDHGNPQVIRNSDGDLTTATVIWLDGRRARIGNKAEQMRDTDPDNVYSLTEPCSGRSIDAFLFALGKQEQSNQVTKHRGYPDFMNQTAVMRAIILRKLKIEVMRHFKELGRIDRCLDERDFELNAVMVVPDWFGDIECRNVQFYCFLGGLNRVHLINKTAAIVISHYPERLKNGSFMVFDLDASTCEVTILRMRNGVLEVIGSAGDNTLGCKNWDELIRGYIYEQFRKQNGCEIPDDRGFEVQQKAIQARIELTDNDETSVFMSLEQGELNATLYRTAPFGEASVDECERDPDKPFFFNERAEALLSRCRGLCLRALQQSGMKWSHLDDILLAGGACRMPMIAEMLHEASKMKIMQHRDGFRYDTAIAIGAAIYGQEASVVQDVASHSIGVEYVQDRRHYVEHLLPKDKKLPARIEKVYRAGPNAELVVYEGESNRPDECVLRGRLELDNPQGEVKIILEADTNGMLTVSAEYPPHGRQVMELKNELYVYDQRALPLREKIQSLIIEL